MSELAITSRCLRDDLPELEVHVRDNLLVAFYERMGKDPEFGPLMRGISGVPLHKLHADSAGVSVRGVTCYDRPRDVCWLLTAGNHDEAYRKAERLARVEEHLPTATDWADFDADAPIRLMHRVITDGKSRLEDAIAHPGTSVAITDEERPRGYFQVDAEILRLRLLLYGKDGVPLTPAEIAAVSVAVWGRNAAGPSNPRPEDWEAIYLEGVVPNLEDWPPADRFIFNDPRDR